MQVTTRSAPEQDIDALEQAHRGLLRQGFADLEHFVDAGYITPESIDQAACLHDVVLTGPVRVDPRAREHPGFAKADFAPDWEAHTLTCPRNVTSHSWRVTRDDGHERLSVLFPKPACRVCEARQECTGNTEGRGRHIMLLPRPLQEIQTRVRREQDTPQWRQHYAIRAGCDATVSETVRVHGLRHCRYRGGRPSPGCQVGRRATRTSRVSAGPTRLQRTAPARPHPARRSSRPEDACAQCGRDCQSVPSPAVTRLAA
ncbi:hypothetical protein GCM10010129_81760 [Streptomyces fumigatiscleroticus]|nr:hypothetical protein GCM10010129_81760 [Streptomyces fumigatiscleroticus]